MSRARLDGVAGALSIATTGVHLGAFGWLEDVRPRPRDLTPVALDDDLAKVFDPDGTSPHRLLKDTP